MATWPLLSPTARRSPRLSKRTAVTSRAPSASASRPSKGQHEPRRSRCLGSQHCTSPSEVPAATMPCVGSTPSTLMPEHPARIGERNEPRSSESRKISSPAPARSSSHVSAQYATARPKWGIRVRWCLPNCEWVATCELTATRMAPAGLCDLLRRRQLPWCGPTSTLTDGDLRVEFDGAVGEQEDQLGPVSRERLELDDLGDEVAGELHR